MFSEAHGTPIDQITFIFAGRQLEDDHTCSEYRITRGSAVHHVIRLRED
jgi:hypothetical protein